MSVAFDALRQLSHPCEQGRKGGPAYPVRSPCDAPLRAGTAVECCCRGRSNQRLTHACGTIGSSERRSRRTLNLTPASGDERRSSPPGNSDQRRIPALRGLKNMWL